MGVPRILDYVVEKAREQEVFSREETPTEQRVEAAFLYHYRFVTSPRQAGTQGPYEVVHQ